MQHNGIPGPFSALQTERPLGEQQTKWEKRTGKDQDG